MEEQGNYGIRARSPWRKGSVTDDNRGAYVDPLWPLEKRDVQMRVSVQ